MRKIHAILGLLSLVILIMSCDKKGTDNSLLISTQGVGPFVLGGTIPGAVDGYEIENDTDIPGGVPDFFRYTKASEKGVRVLGFTGSAGTDNIDQIIIYSNKFRTAEGIGLGSTIVELAKAYPNSKIYFDPKSETFTFNPNIGDDTVFIGVTVGEITDYLGDVDLSNLDWNDQETTFKASDLKPEAKATSIWLNKTREPRDVVL